MLNAKKTTETVDAKSLDRLARVLGAFDENLNFLGRELELVAYVDGVKIRLEGKQENVAIGKQALTALLKLADSGEPLDTGRLAYCIELAREGRAEEIETLEEGIVAITARGKKIKCKTVGQKAYVDAIKQNTVVFGVGPAGTGKTYLAVCMAVSAFKSKQVEKIILTRPAVEAGEKLGFLPGDLQTKVDPYLRPLY
ncbi:MAG: PhoH family protein, partial [Clostridia bacterium]|nr:PhoH family protein [Clostridia bacterium]